MGKFLFTTNLEPGSTFDVGQVYWRAYWRLCDDHITSMLADHVLGSLASIWYDVLVLDDKVINYNRTALTYCALERLNASPLSILAREARLHIADVLISSVIVEEES